VTQHVLDSSAILAWLQDEPGSDVVDPLLDEGIISAANWSEVLQKAAQKGRAADETGELLKGLGLEVTPLIEEEAGLAASLWFQASFLALADRCCLALAQRLGAPAVTADDAWRGIPVAVEIVVIR
jgi:PIN domain nuclease of toxin-antitoxin system